MAVNDDGFVDFYRVLDVATGVDNTALRRAYMHLAKALHPDVEGGDAAKMQLLNRAYQTLKDPSKRRVYDLMHQAHTGTATLFYRTAGGPSQDLSSRMTDDEIDRFIDTVYQEIRAVQPTKPTTLTALKAHLFRRNLHKKP